MSFSFEKLLSSDATLTGRVQTISGQPRDWGTVSPNVFVYKSESSSAVMSSQGMFGKFLTSTACSFSSMSLLNLLNVLQRWLHNSCTSSYLILSNTLAEA